MDVLNVKQKAKRKQKQMIRKLIEKNIRLS